MLALLCTMAQGISAQTPVSTEKELTDAIADGATNIQLTNDITLNDYLNIGSGVNVTIDLAGNTLGRSLNDYSYDGHVIWANGCDLTLTSSVAGGSIEGGKANTGGGIMISAGTTVTAINVTFQNNLAADHAGAVWNNGTFAATDCTFKNNTASDVGAIYNSISADGAGTATLTRCTFTANTGTTGAGALANALGATVMTIEDCTIENNTAASNGGGIWNGGTLNMKGEVKVTGNTRAGGASNVFLKPYKGITVTGALTGSSIGVELEIASGTFTSGYKTYHDEVAPSTFFTADHSDIRGMELDDDGEACMTTHDIIPVSYIERSWDDTNKKVISTEKTLKGIVIGYDTTPTKGQNKEVTNAPDDDPDDWFGMGGYSTTVPEYYVVRGNVNRKTIVVQGSDVHLILCDGATLTLTGGMKVEGDNRLYIHCQSYGDNMGRLMVTNYEHDESAAIGSAYHDYKSTKVGELVIHGGHIEAEAGSHAAGIGSCSNAPLGDGNKTLCKSVTVYGGFVRAIGGMTAAGIGGGEGINGGDFILYDGTVIAEGGTGVGGGHDGVGGNVTVYGGSLTATGGGGAGIGSGILTSASNRVRQSGGTFTIFNGTVTASSSSSGAGIGGGSNGGGAGVIIYDGTVTATGGDKAAGIGGGYMGFGGTLTISGGTVIATGGEKGAGIGGGSDYYGGTVNISGGTVTAIGGAKAAGIGGGFDGRGGDVTITGGTVIASAGDQGGEGNRAIGPGKARDVYGTLTIGNAMMVGAGNNGSVERTYNADERVNACWYRSYAEISPCTHPAVTYTVSGTDVNGTHTKHCSHCTTTFTAEPHDFNGTDECTVCHYKGTVYTVTIYLPDAKDDDTYTTDGAYKTYTYDMVAGTSFTLPGAPQDLYDMEFAGWLVTTGAPSFSTYKASTEEMSQLLAEKAPYKLEGNVNFVARYKDIFISLADGSDNGETLYTYNRRQAASVTLTGRTLYKDGKWNTLCLPFEVKDFTGTPLAGATVMELGNSDACTTGFDAATGTLTLDFVEANKIEAGHAYIVKWSATTPNYIENPVFNGVTIANESPADQAVVSSDGYVTFVGTYSPMAFTAADKSILFLGSNNKLYYPQPSTGSTLRIGAQRAYFQLNNGLTCGEPANPGQGGGSVRAFVLNFGDEETGILSTTNFTNSTNSDAWYSLDGRKLNGKPTTKGLYINNGCKVVIK